MINKNQAIKIESFYKKYFGSNKEVIDVPLKVLRELKNEGVTTEHFLDYLCQKKGLLLHGSINKIKNGKLISENNKIFSSNKSAIAIMRSLYSNVSVNLQYPYFINDRNPLILKIHTRGNGKFTKKDTGFVYIVNSDGFKNKPKGSWQFVKEAEEVNFIAVIEIKKDDFNYPVEIFEDYASVFLGKIVTIKIDRPVNSKHPKHGFIYEVNYGFVPNAKAPDGEEIDAYLLGINEPVEKFTGKCIAVIHRKNDDDDKLVIVPEDAKEMNDEEILRAVNFQEKWFDSVVVR